MAEALVGSGMPPAAAENGVREPSDDSANAFAQLRAVADAVLYEGYLLYPYRRSSPKNRVRWQFGVLFPRNWVEHEGPVPPGISGSADSWYQRTECLVVGRRPDALVRVGVRYLQMQHKQVEEADRHGRYRPVESLRTDDGTIHLTFVEAVPHERDVVVRLDELVREEHTFPVGSSDGEEIEPLPGGTGRLVRRRAAVGATSTVRAERVEKDVYRLRIRTENTESAPDSHAARDEALSHALIATHTLIGGDGVEFRSLIDPPPSLEGHARDCRNAFTFPVLGGGSSSAVLSAPIILPDHPQVAPESPGDLHDAAEIDEILTLRTLLLTDEEKREARATDRRAAEILDRVETMPPEVFSRLHGAIRSLVPAPPGVPSAATRPAVSPCPEGTAPSTASTAPRDPARPTWWQEGADDDLSPVTDTVLVDGVPVGNGHRVRLRPRVRGADAQDMFLAGRTARVAAVFHDVDGGVYLAVTIDDDPAAELHDWYGRYHYFRPDEVEPLAPLDVTGRPTTPDPPRLPHERPRQPADGPEKGRSDGRS
ncbi:hypothetical protein SSP24_29910 [Streptomyces spinoverrucosus]|uniref:Uncharacterized protein n=1 Tax=Streptomyces spinoverrucosus TaxID=284043 RepID=A0A4Y3VJY3_9ACTN|nr:hypothetical protein [Streptomyces spinoverrucosus]GEC05336.1 hypothetical protein SSP24_29910 [Streptomyces spinoverrucosus]GHB79046.1 hypothetical protein GCM10010397_57140 [Streptomyces spinoverrucosus]